MQRDHSLSQKNTAKQRQRVGVRVESDRGVRGWTNFLKKGAGIGSIYVKRL